MLTHASQETITLALVPIQLHMFKRKHDTIFRNHLTERVPRAQSPEYNQITHPSGGRTCAFLSAATFAVPKAC